MERQKPDQAASKSPAEQAARSEFEQCYGRPLTDAEWSNNRSRMIEFVKILARWDAEQRHCLKCAKIEAKPNINQVA